MALESDRRNATRHDVELPLKVRIAQPELADTPSLLETSTIDISTTGIGFTLSEDCELGSMVDCVLVLPGGAPQDPPVQLRLKGKIVRIDKGTGDESGRISVGATIEEYSLTFK